MRRILNCADFQFSMRLSVIARGALGSCSSRTTPEFQGGAAFALRPNGFIVAADSCMIGVVLGVATLDITQLEMTLDHVPDLVFFVKDQNARYVALNHTLVLRTGVPDKAALRGKTARAVFPEPLGESYEAQDHRVLRTGIPVEGRLELHLYRPAPKAGA